MINAVVGSLFLMDGDDRFSDEIDIDDVDLIGRSKRKRRKPCQKDERAHHVELGGFRVPAVAQNDARPEDRMSNVRQ